MQNQAPRRITIHDVAREARVSVTTVSHALNDKGYVDPKTRERVKEVATALGYRPDIRAQRLRTGKAQSIALLSSMPFTVSAGPARLGFLMEIAATAASEALTKGLALMLVPPYSAGDFALDRLDMDGAIVVEPVEDDPQVAMLRSLGFPIVSIGRFPGPGAIPFVDLHSHATARLLLQHLSEQGATCIALMIGSSRRNSYLESEAAYRAFCAQSGQAPIIVKVDESDGEAGGRQGLVTLVRDHPEVDALCASVDTFASGAVAAAKQLGMAIPDDLRIVTRYDGLRARQSDPPLTAVDMHLEEVATLAVHLLFQQLEGPRSDQAVQPSLPALVPRASSMKAGRS
jgi:DNA-binding LacI/PurR family transcriptional regulator